LILLGAKKKSINEEKSSYDLKQLIKDNFVIEVFLIEPTISEIFLLDKNIFWKENSDKFFRYKNKIGKVSLNISKLELLELKKSLVNIISKEIKFLQFNTNEYNMDK
jgi:hypothetical protein